ncbi:SUF system Fe-S cluster assembly regulator [Acidisoma silvae]|uniref:SUF system Fe-S cluster assembly regulator n=1 Tax=Acidisoma silvae TaxID=2802396 RepID=A0A963YQD7_9PROT|nr:SUF system Fe-S cluster assembly regulator [Acidisoma silvae]MCB8874999.1 SUF system Fe-S cluster assembly regulator [Acidisoma silvae]
MLKLSKLTDYAVVVLVRLGDDFALQTSGGIAAATGVPEPTVAKVLKIMTTAGLVCSQRGARGGYRLAKPLSAIPVADVITAIDGPIALTACVEHSPAICDSSALCPVKGRWDRVNSAILDALSGISLADMRPPERDALSVVPMTEASAMPSYHPAGASVSTTAFVE